MEHKRNHCVLKRCLHMVDSLQNGVGNRGQGEEYDSQRTVHHHADQVGVIVTAEQQIAHGACEHGKSYRGRNRDHHGKANDHGNPAHDLSAVFACHRPRQGRNQGGGQRIGYGHRNIKQQVVLSGIDAPG